MKRIIFSVIFIAAVLSVCIFEQAEINKDFDEIIILTDNAIAAESGEEKQKYCERLSNEWDDIHKWVALTTDHSLLHGTEVAVAQALEFSKTKYADETDEALIEAKSELTQLFDASKITLGNIF